MCEKQDRINKLEQELVESHQREAMLFETLASAKNHESQIVWKPWQVVATPLAVSIVGALGAITIALAK